jgi:spoIIIJ-associated protein
MSFQDWTVEAIEPKLDGFLGPLLEAARLDLNYAVESGENLQNRNLFSPDLIVDFEGPDADLLLAQRAELLMALEQLTLEALRVAHQERYRLIFDCQDYRVLRIEELRLSAEAAAEKVQQSGIPFRFQPMSSRERRILHLALRDCKGIKSGSEGVAPRRHTVIYAADPKERL